MGGNVIIGKKLIATKIWNKDHIVNASDIGVIANLENLWVLGSTNSTYLSWNWVCFINIISSYLSTIHTWTYSKITKIYIAIQNIWKHFAIFLYDVIITHISFKIPTWTIKAIAISQFF